MVTDKNLMNKITLNFLPLSDQNFTITIYRKEANKSHERSETGIRFRLKLSKYNNYQEFDISWNKLDGFDEYICDAKENFDLTKRYLLRSLENRLEEVACSFQWYFPPKSFYNELRFIIKEYKEGNSEIILMPYFLKNHLEFGFLIQHHFKVNSNQPFNREVQKLSLSLDNRYQQNRSFYGDKFRLISDFINSVIANLGNLFEDISIVTKLADTPSDKLDTKQYKFGGGNQSSSPFVGIKQNGPYKVVSDEVKYLFVFTEPLRSLAREVYSGLDGKLFHGMFSGLESMFSLPFSKNCVEYKLVINYNNAEMAEVIEKAVEMIGKNNCKVCVLTFFPSLLTEDKNKEIYSHLKFQAIKHGFYTQTITQETMGKKEQLKWSIGNIGLQIFSKLGGIPWLLIPSHEKCLIFGIGSAHEKDSEGNIIKYTAYTVCIDTKGNFNRVQPLSSSENEGEYLIRLKEELIKIICSENNTHIEECVIHVPYKVSRQEVDIIKKSVQEVTGDISFQIKVIKINSKHKFLGFSYHNTKIPYESSMVQLSNTEYLIWTEGLQYGNPTVSRRVSEPLHVEFLHGSENNYDDDKSYLQDIINLTGANWRGFNSKAQPVSIYYPWLIATFMKRFSKYEAVGDFSILSCESFNPWFL
ncbi:Piwi domain-containing protein [Methylovulum miyakonense]|uniref:Piwi domain-containing protein n=1 Tax=Methylovulum miyakonense TaxID=645578 RepID=UPI00035D0C4C|nr:Piwi domain-containing protein [Methylovulum miyakonense]